MGIFEQGNQLKASDFKSRCKATVRRNGDLGFTDNAINLMGLDKGSRVFLSALSDGNLAAIARPNCDDETGFPVKKNGIYCSIALKPYFDQVGIPYADESQRVIYDIVATNEQHMGCAVFKLTKRVRPSAQRGDDDTD